MATSITHTSSVNQESIKVTVDFFDSEEKGKLLKYSTADKIGQVVEDGLNVSVAEFLTYYLFHKKRPGKPGWREYKEVGRKIHVALAELEDWVDFNGISINTSSGVDRQSKHITECVGESIGLSVINHVHDLTSADWDHIPEHPGRNGIKTFDYKLASDNSEIIHVENKGSSVQSNLDKNQSVQNHKNNITKKKGSIKELEQTSGYRYPATVRYGTICVVGKSASDPVKCLLVDPPADGDGEAARRLRVLQRMRFLRDWISFVSPRSPFAAALQTRVASLEVLSNPFELDGVEILRGVGEPFAFVVIDSHSSFFAAKSKVIGTDEGGMVVPMPGEGLFFLGFREDLVEQAARQQFQVITDYRTEFEARVQTVQCVLSVQAFRNYPLSDVVKSRASLKGGYYIFEMQGLLFYSDSGLVFGSLITTR